MNAAAQSVNAILARIVNGLSIDIDAAAEAHLYRFTALIARWNRVHNLTSAKTPQQIALRHVGDCLSVVPAVTDGWALDLGSGAGLPGIVLGICRPQLSVVLLDASRKRTAFCVQVCGELGLSNVEAVHSRIEDFGHRSAADHAESGFDWVLTRGYGSLADCWRASCPQLRLGGALVAMKGKLPQRELAELGELGENARTETVAVPGLAEERHMVIVRKNRNNR